jgi:hypothetical protein
MAKPQAKGLKAAKRRDPARDKASEEEARLRAYHALGKKVLALAEDAKPGEDPVKKLHKETGDGVDKLRKARVFARVYDDDELDDLCKLRMPDQGLRANMPLAWRLVRQLLMVPRGEQREALQRKAAERGWSPDELKDAIPVSVRRGQTRREGGRAFRRPKTAADALRQVVRHGDEWLRRYGKAWETFDWLASKRGAAGPGGLTARIAEARQTLKSLGAAARKLDARIKRLECELAGSKGERE